MREQTTSRSALEIRTFFIFFFALATLACQSGSVSAGKTPPDPNRAAETKMEVAEQWLGKWDGPEGTFLEISRDAPGFKITIRNLDGPRTFTGTPRNDGLTFTRDGKTETIRAGNGEDTGMKWLLDKKNCLVIEKGEGYCRE
jgi:hypothetical protein